MAKFLVVHPVGKDLTLEAATPIAKAIKASLPRMPIGSGPVIPERRAISTASGMQKIRPRSATSFQKQSRAFRQQTS